MTEFVSDPCELLEEPSGSAEGPSVPPVSSSMLSTPSRAFPTMQSLETEQAIIRESSLINSTLFNGESKEKERS